MSENAATEHPEPEPEPEVPVTETEDTKIEVVDSATTGLDDDSEDSLASIQAAARVKTQSEFPFGDDFGTRIVDGLKTGLLCDLKFVIGPEHRVFRAHRIIVAIGCPVFYAALTSGFAESVRDGEYVIADIDATAFEQFLLYCYSDGQRLTGINVFPTLILAQRYNVDRLIAFCEEFIENQLKPDTALDMLIHASKLGLDATVRRLLKRTLQELDLQSALVDRENTAELPFTLVSAIIGSDFITSGEEPLFDFCMKWLGIDLSEGHTIDDVKLSDEAEEQFANLMYNIRFYDMDLAFFGDRVVTSRAVSPEQAVAVYRLAIALQTRRVPLKELNMDEFEYPFNGRPRAGSMRRLRFSETLKTASVLLYDGGYGCSHAITTGTKNCWVLAEHRKVKTGIHTWRFEVEASGSWFMIGIAVEKDYGQGEDVQLFNKSDVYGLIFNSGSSVSAVRNGNNTNIGEARYTQEGKFEVYMRYNGDTNVLDFNCPTGDWEKSVDNISSTLEFVPGVNLYYPNTKAQIWSVPNVQYGKKMLKD